MGEKDRNQIKSIMVRIDIKVTKVGSTLEVLLGRELSTSNAPALMEELAKYQGQGIEKIVFNATALSLLTSKGITTVIYAHRRLGSNPEIVFLNCAKEIYDVLDHVGLTRSIKFEENLDKKLEFRRDYLSDLDKEETDRITNERKEALDHYEAHNDVVCYSMKIGQED